MAQLAAGLTLSYPGGSGKATRFTLNDGDEGQNRPRISAAHLGSDPDQKEPFVYTWAAPSNGSYAKTATVEFFGTGGPAVGGAGTISGPGFSVTGTVVASSSIAQVGDFVRGSVTVGFK